MKPSQTPSSNPSLLPTSFSTTPLEPSLARRSLPTAKLAQVTQTDSRPHKRIAASTKAMRKPNKTGIKPTFIQKMYDILSKPDYEPYISWTADGKAFTIKDREYFTAKILPKYFKTQQFHSFKKQLNVYNFWKVSSGLNVLTMKHPLFMKGADSTATLIKRGRQYGQALTASARPSTQKTKKGSKRRSAIQNEKVTPQKNYRLKNSGSKTKKMVQANSAAESKILTPPATQEMQVLVEPPRHALLQRDHMDTTTTPENLPAIMELGLSQDDVIFADDLFSDKINDFCVTEPNNKGRNNASVQ